MFTVVTGKISHISLALTAKVAPHLGCDIAELNGLAQRGHPPWPFIIPSIVHADDLGQTNVHEGIGVVCVPVGNALTPHVYSS